MENNQALRACSLHLLTPASTSIHPFVQLVLCAAAARVENNQALKACPQDLLIRSLNCSSCMRVGNNQALKAHSMHLLEPAVTFVQGLCSHLWMRSFVHSCILLFVLICAVLCCAVLCCAVLCCAVQTLILAMPLPSWKTLLARLTHKGRSNSTQCCLLLLQPL